MKITNRYEIVLTKKVIDAPSVIKSEPIILIKSGDVGVIAAVEQSYAVLLGQLGFSHFSDTEKGRTLVKNEGTASIVVRLKIREIKESENA